MIFVLVITAMLSGKPIGAAVYNQSFESEKACNDFLTGKHGKAAIAKFSKVVKSVEAKVTLASKCVQKEDDTI